MAERKNSYYRELLMQLTPNDLLPGALEMVKKLRRRRIKTAIGSSSKNTPLILERCGLTKFFDAVADGNDVTRSKPDPEIFLVAAERLKLEPVACLVIEDGAAGVEAARRAGMAVFGIGTEERLPGVKHLAPDLSRVSIDALLARGPKERDE